MEHEHLDDAVLERLLAVDRNDDQNRELFHLLAVCPRCREAGGWLLDLHRKGALPARFGPVDAALARSRAEAPQLWQESEENAYDAALATLDLVVPCLQEGNTAEVRTLAEEMVTVFRQQEVGREALAAWLLFHQAAVREAVTVELTREVAASLLQARGGGA